MSNTFDAQRIQQDFERDGFVILPDFLDAPTLDRINTELDAHYAPLLGRTEEILTGRLQDFKQFECDVIAWDPVAENNCAFCDLKDDPRLAQVTAAAIGEGFTAPASLVMLAVGGGKGQAWHQDCPSENPDQFNLNRLFYTRDVRIEDGAIVVVPASHRRGRIPAGGNQEPIEGEVALMPKAGTLILLSGHVYHRVTPNTSDKPRLSVNFRAFPENVAPDVCDVGVYRGGAYDFHKGQRIA